MNSRPRYVDLQTLLVTKLIVVCTAHLELHLVKQPSKLFNNHPPATMAAATQLGMSASSFLCPASITSKRVLSTYSRPSATLIVCQQAGVSRRVFAVASAAATTVGAFTVPEAQAKRKPPPQEEKKVEPEEKNLSAYDARILANARRKEAMKATVEAAKAKAKSIIAAPPSIAQSPPQ